MEIVLPYVDTVIHDIKLMDKEKHRFWTGASNERSLSNLKRAYQTWPEKTFLARTPVIPGVNDDEDSIQEIMDFILPYPNVKGYELMPYHRLGIGKYISLGKDYSLEEFPSPAEETILRLRNLITETFAKR